LPYHRAIFFAGLGNLIGQIPKPANFCELQEKPRYRIRHLAHYPDEEKHRAVIHAMVATLKGSLTWTKPSDSLEEAGDLTEMRGKLSGVTDELIRLEKSGIRDYKLLSKEGSGYYHGLFKILLDSMIRDSEKHVELLEFLKENLKNA
jgi:hypothetical protein